MFSFLNSIFGFANESTQRLYVWFLGGILSIIYICIFAFFYVPIAAIAGPAIPVLYVFIDMLIDHLPGILDVKDCYQNILTLKSISIVFLSGLISVLFSQGLGLSIYSYAIVVFGMQTIQLSIKWVVSRYIYTCNERKGFF